MSRPASARNLLAHPAGWIATGFGVGFSPRAPGTVGSLVALLPWWFLFREMDPRLYVGCLLAAFALGVWAGNWAIDRTGINDPGFVVWDEFIGQWLALFLVPDGWAWVAAAFVLFRVFDIWKPWPVRWADRTLHGGFGAMFDDLLAGAYAFIVLQVVALLLRN